MLYKLIKWSRQIRIWLGGNKERERRFKIFHVYVDDLAFRQRLIPLGYQENLFSHTFKNQIATVRRLDKDGKHQYHLRFYSDGGVTGHYEMDYFTHQKEHLAGRDLRRLKPEEIQGIMKVFK